MMTVAELLKDKSAQSGHALHTIGPDARVSEAVAIMTQNDISSILVLENGDMVGLITLRELLQGLSLHGAGLVTMHCRNVMKVNPPAAAPEDTIDHLRSLMTERHITHVPVLNQGSLAGILSFHDIARSAIKDAVLENKLLKQYIRNWPK